MEMAGFHKEFFGMVAAAPPGFRFGEHFRVHGRSQDFFQGGEHFFQKSFQKILKKFSKNIQKIFKNNSNNFQKIFKKFLKKIAKNALF